VKASDRFQAGPVRATCRCCGRVYDVLNLSLGGFFLAGESHPRIGETMRLELHLPEQGTIPIGATVAWTNEGDDRRAPELPTGFGVRIMTIDMVHKIGLIHYLRHIEGQQRIR
jgi:hypothetical protein